MNESWKQRIKENIFFIFKAFLFSLIVVNFIGRVSIVKGSSMEPEIRTDERVLINLFVYHFEQPSRGDIVVFKYPRDPNKDYIKRVVAVSGDKVEIKGGRVYLNEEALLEPYVERQDRTTMEKRVVPAGYLFVMGDNRANSEDSRAFGFLSVSHVKGKALLIFWPFDHLRLLSAK